MSGPRVVWVDGRLVPAMEPQLRVDDRGFQLGDGAFETLRARRGVAVELAEHLLRLHQSTDILQIRLSFSDEQLAKAIRELLAREKLDARGDAVAQEPGDASVRVTVSRGPIVRRGLLPAGFDTSPATVVVQAWPYVPPPPELLERGLSAITATIRRDAGSPLAGVKSTSRADYVHARLEADRAGVDDALFLTTHGRLSEGTTSNLFAVLGRRLATPPLSAGILAGTTRTWLLSHAGGLGYEASEEDLQPDDLVATDEAFLCSSVAGLVPLVALDGRAIGAGRPGQRTLELREAREAWIDDCSRDFEPLRR